MTNVTRGVLAITLFAAACGSDPQPAADASVRPDAELHVPQGDHHPYVIDSITLPTNDTESQALGLDIDGDLAVDNGLGTVIALLSSNGNDPNAAVTQQIDQGEIIHLADLQTRGLDDATDVGLFIWQGANPQPAACIDTFDTECRHHFTGTGSFDVTSEDPGTAMIFGDVSGGHYSGTSGAVFLEVPLLVGDAPLRLKVIGAHAEVDITDTAMTAGKLGGAVPDTYMQSDVLPQIAATMTTVIERDCSGTSPNCCTADSDGETVVNLFDSDADCDVTLQELYDSSLLDIVLAPDLDLLDEEGLDGSDGEDDSLSLGLGFTAVRAIYETPAGL